jgi:hypothetical protein
MRSQPGFFDVDDRLKRLSDLGDQLEAFQAAVDFEIFRVDLMSALAYYGGAQGRRAHRALAHFASERLIATVWTVIRSRSGWCWLTGHHRLCLSYLVSAHSNITVWSSHCRRGHFRRRRRAAVTSSLAE